jgi:hypothetical protein
MRGTCDQPAEGTPDRDLHRWDVARIVDGPTVTETSGDPSVWTESMERLRVLIVAGVATGVVIAGIGSRAAMFVLRLTSSDNVVGVTSDDGFTIGRFTLAGTYNLLALGAAVGFLGAVAYRAVAPWLVGPSWFRRLTTSVGAGAVVGSMLIHADGVDFTMLKPTWLAISLFVALPAMFGAVIGTIVDRVATPSSWTSRGAWRWVIPLVFVGFFPQTLPLLIIAVPLMRHITSRRRRVWRSEQRG